jgi:DNA-binding transcriptional LysR family regulator
LKEGFAVSNPGTPTFDQLRIFLTIVDTGSFAGAARKLNRAVSVISYGIANLEAQLGLTLFDREGTRKPTLTVAGRALLSEARGVAQGSTRCAPRSRACSTGWRPRSMWRWM